MYFGCIADDFTGGSDIASFFSKGGLNTVLFNGIPESEELMKGIDVCVIALKTRTQETASAVEISLEAIDWLKNQGAEQFYIKYCSTFDSTPKGNIGPICDAVMDKLEVDYTIINPALPVNGRTVTNGCLYVHGVPLHESSMKDHPLTPMWDCDLKKLMDAQSKYTSVKLPQSLSEEAVKQFIEKTKHKFKSTPFYIIPDYEKEEDDEYITRVFGDLRLITGGSGLAESLAESVLKEKKAKPNTFKKLNTPTLLLAGSTSVATRNQVESFKDSGGISYFVNPEKLLTGEETTENIWSFIQKNKGNSVLIYSSDTPENIKRIKKEDRIKVADLLEQTNADIAERAINNGYHKIIVAGGETSGAVTKRLGFHAYYIGESIAPGVPIMIPIQDERIRLVLKSGNFGDRNFFLEAISLK